MKRALLLLACALALACASALACTSREDDALLQAAREYVLAEIGMPKFTLTLDEQAGGYARLTATPLEPRPYSATVFMKREGGTWRGLAIGTAFEPDELRELGVPEALR